MPLPDGSHALDHIVVVLFENRSLWARQRSVPPTGIRLRRMVRG